MQHILFRADQRGTKDTGWLKSRFFFSFSDFYDPTKSAFGSLVAFNDDVLQAGRGFGTHPHVNMEIISIMLQGKMNHKDSMGYSTVVEEGGVQIMSAGSGLRHEEYNIGEDEVKFLQIWIEPKLQNITPRYQQRSFPKASRKNELKTIISNEEGMGHCWINQNAKLSLGHFEEQNQLNYSFNPVNKCLFIFSIEGKLSISGVQIEERDAIGIWNTDNVEIKSEAGSQYLVIETPVNQK